MESMKSNTKKKWVIPTLKSTSIASTTKAIAGSTGDDGAGTPSSYTAS
jgi:hypothetical protein